MKRRISLLLVIALLVSMVHLPVTAKGNMPSVPNLDPTIARDLPNMNRNTDNRSDISNINGTNTGADYVVDLSTIEYTGGSGGEHIPHGYPGVYTLLLSYGNVITLGNLDLRYYSACEITYATDLGFVAQRDGMMIPANFSLKSNNVCIGAATQDPQLDGLLAQANCTDVDKNNLHNPDGMNWDKDERVCYIDLTNVDYSGEVWLSHFNATGNEALVSKIKFVANSNDTPDIQPPMPSPTRVFTYDGGVNVGVWAGNTDGRKNYHAVSFNAASDFVGFGVPQTWCSNGTNAPLVTYEVELFNYVTDYNTTVEGTPVFHQTVTPAGNDSGEIYFDFGETMPMGEYTIRFTVTSDEGYLVLPEPGRNLYSSARLEYTDDAFAFYVDFIDFGLSDYFDLLSTAEEEIIDVALYTGSGRDPHNLIEGPIAVVISVPTGYTLRELIGIQCPTWGFHESGSNASVKVYNWNGDYDSSIEGAVIASGSVTNHPDNNNAVYALSQDIPSGTYLAEFTSEGTESIGFWCFTSVNEEEAICFLNGSEAYYWPDIHCKFVSGLNSEEPSGPSDQYAGPWAYVSGTNNIGIYLRQEGDYAAAIFEADAPFSAIQIPRYWASNNERTLELDLYTFTGSLESSLTGTPVASKEFSAKANNNEGVYVAFPEVGVGVYVICVKLNSVVGSGYFSLPGEGNKQIAEYYTTDANKTFNFGIGTTNTDSAFGTYIGISIPDQALRNYVFDNVDTDNNYMLSDDEKAAVMSMNLDGLGVSSLKGLELFGNLISLSCTNNDMNEIDLSGLGQLEYLDCSGNNFAMIDITACPNLVDAVINGEISESDETVTYTLNAFGLTVDKNVIIHTGNSAFDQVVMINEENFPDEWFRNFVTQFDLDGSGSFDIEELAAVKEMFIYYEYNYESSVQLSSIKGIEFFFNLEELNISCNPSDNDGDGWFEINELYFDETNLSQNTKLNRVVTEYINFESLNLNKLLLLNTLMISNGGCSELDLSKTPNIEALELYNSRFDNIDISALDSLNYLNIMGCSGTVDISDNLRLLEIMFYYDRNEYVETIPDLNGGEREYPVFHIYVENEDVISFLIEKVTDIVVSISVDETIFDDAAFLNYIIENIDSDNNGILNFEEIDAVQEISVENASDLNGIEYFHNLKLLDCTSCSLTNLDFSHNPKLANAVAYGQRTESDGIVTYSYEDAILIVRSDVEIYTGIPYYDNRIIINEANFPDANFREFVKSFDLNGDGGLVQAELDAVTEIVADGLGIESLVGIEFFTNLTSLSLTGNSLTEFDFAAFPNLTYLNLSGNLIETLNLSSHTGFAEAVAYGTRTVIDESVRNEKDGFVLITDSNVALYTGIPYYDDRIIINEANFPDANFREFVKSFDLNGDGGFVQAELDAVTEMIAVDLGIESLGGIEFFTNLSYLDCSGNLFEALDISFNQGFVEAVAYGTRTVIDESVRNEKEGFVLITDSNVAIYTGISYYDNRIIINEANFPDANFREFVKSFDLNGDGGFVQAELDAVTEIVADNLGIESITGIEFFTNLTSLSLTGNSFAEFDISAFPNLTYLNLSGNLIEALDISAHIGFAEAVAYGTRTVADEKVTFEKDGFVLITDSEVVFHTGIPGYDDRLIISAAFFPDDIFREYLRVFDLNDDGALTDHEVELVTEINVDGLGVSSLEGIEYFANLQVLSCRDNNLEALDIGANVLLEELHCEGNAIASIFVGNTPGLETVLRNAAPTSIDGVVTYSFGTGCISASAEMVILTGDDDFDDRLPVDEAHFPDANFRAYIVEQFGLVDRMYLYKSEYTTLEYMDVNSRNIATLRGIEYFTGLKTLNCFENQLTELDLSANTLLEELFCPVNQLTTLDLSANTLLKTLTCYNNQLAELNLSKNTMLTNLDCANNQLSALDLSANHLLESIDCQNNRLLELDLDGLSEINTITCSNNLFKILDLSGKEKLVSLYYQSELLETLIIDGCSSLNYLPANTNGSLITFSARNCTSLSYVALYNNLLESIDLTGCTGLTSLDVSYNQLTELDLSGLSMLSDVSCYNNKIKNIRLEGCDSLANLNASNNKLKELDLLDCAMLREVYLWSNTTQIEIDISECTYLRNDYLKGRSVINGNCTVYTGVEVNEQNFPDAIFRNYISTTVDTNGSTILSRKELNRIESIDLMNAGISSFEGLKYLDRIVSLRVSGNPIDKLDLVGLERLAVLICQDTNVTELEISDCPNLVDAYVNGTVSSESTSYITYDSDFGYLAINRSIVISMGIPIDAEHFPDENFRSYVQNAFDLNTNGYLGQTEREQVTQINVSGRGITSLEGIFYFINTVVLNCSSNPLSALDLSALPKLENLDCSGNLLTSLDLSANSKLLSLSCQYNSILELDLSQNTSIRYLACYRNGMTKLTILNCDKLIETIREGEKTSEDAYDYFHYNYDGEDIYLYLDKTLKISTGKEPATVYSLTSTLNGTVEMNVYLVLPDFILEDPGAYVKFSKDGDEKTVMVADVLASPSIKDGVVRYVFSYEIVAKEFRDIVNVKLFDSTGRSIQLITRLGVDYGTDGYPYPLSRYLLDRMNNSTNENMRNLARAMLDYGSAAQLYFNYNVDDSIVVTNAVSSIQYSEFDPYESVKSDDADKPDGFVKNTFSLVLEGDTALKMYYNFNSGYDPFSYQYYIDGEAATLHKEGEKYFLVVEDIVAKELDVAHEFTISDGTKSYTIISSALSYARYLAGLSDTNKQNLGKAILVYNRMAKDYFNSLSN